MCLQAVLKIFEGVTPVVQKGQEMCSIPGMTPIRLLDHSFFSNARQKSLAQQSGYMLGLLMGFCAASVMKSIELCDVDVRRDMYSGIIATGEPCYAWD